MLSDEQKERNKIRCKKYYQEHSERIKEQMRQHYKKNSEQIKENMRQKIRCLNCEKEMRKDSMYYHLKNTCINNIKK